MGPQKNRLIAYVVGTQKNRLNETVLLSSQNICLILWVLQFYAENFCLSKLVGAGACDIQLPPFPLEYLRNCTMQGLFFLKAAKSVIFDLLFSEIMFLIFKNTIKYC